MKSSKGVLKKGRKVKRAGRSVTETKSPLRRGSQKERKLSKQFTSPIQDSTPRRETKDE